MPRRSIVIVCIITLLAGCGSVPLPPVAADPAGVAFWHWYRDRPLSDSDEADLAAIGCDRIAELRAELALAADGSVVAATRGGVVRGAPAIARSAVLRLDPSCHRALRDEAIGAALRAAVLARAPDASASLQLDWDVPESRLAAYARWLAALRAQLPPGQRLEATGLVSWLDRGEIDLVAAELDELLVQVYHLDPPDWDATAVHTARDPIALLPRLERLPCAYRIGLASFEHVSAYAADGTLLAASVPLRLEDLLAAGADELSRSEGDERVRRLRLPATRRLGGMVFPAGGHFVHAAIDPAWIARIRTRLLAAGPTRCRGIALFRLPAAGSLPCVGLEALAHAMAGRTRPAQLEQVLERVQGGWALRLRNSGDRSLTTSRWELDVPPDRVAADLPSGWRLEPAHAGQVVAPIRATASLLEIGLLRPGSELRLAITAESDRAPQLRAVAR